MNFAAKLIAWQSRHGRHGLPWQGTRDPYRVWLSEIMLQQTQVGTVIPYYERFLARFPNVAALARASQDDVLRLWSGLGYYARGRNLHRAAQTIMAHGFPTRAKEIEALPGVGRSTAAAIAVFAFGERAAILDGNVKRVLARCFAIEDESRLWRRAEALLPREDVETYTQALMDLGATVCTRAAPACAGCPVASLCIARCHGWQARLPAKRARGARPQKRVAWMVQRRAGKVWVERRPSPGIWGGLWCFPVGKPRPGDRPLEPIEHGFTHFRLRIRPFLRDAEKRALGKEGRWITLAALERAAVPAPVRTLVRRLRGAAR
ncbi:MAG TPA: A/G-specific adenine glycosylase [Burkholderiales bacterium]|nr:A/G-specific adenine glycosylase [Burkholderiales bacterium]